MACTFHKTPAGIGFILCGPRERLKRCDGQNCGAPAVAQCDYPLRGEKAGKTCSKFLCEKHRTADGDLDFCPPHAKMPRPPAQLGLPVAGK